MEFLVLGSGAFDPPKPGTGEVRNPAGYALLRDKETYLFDFGFGNLRQLVRAGVEQTSVSHVFVSHLHPDHVGDLPALLFSFRYDDKPRTGRLRLFGPPGFKDWMERLRALHGRHVEPKGYVLEIDEIVPGEPIAGAGWKVVARRTEHSVHCNCYRFFADGKSLVYTGDTAYDPLLAGFAAGADLFVLESSMPEKKGIAGVHLGVDQALKVAEAAGAAKTVFTHVTEASARQLRAKLRGKRGWTLARDRMRIKL